MLKEYGEPWYAIVGEGAQWYEGGWMTFFMTEEAAEEILNGTAFHDKCHIMEIQPGGAIKVPLGVEWKFDRRGIKIVSKHKFQIDNIDMVRSMQGVQLQ